MITGERSIGSGMRRIEARHRRGRRRPGARARSTRSTRVAAAVGAQSIDALPDRIAALQDELRETKRRLKAGGGAGLPEAGRPGRGRGRGRAGRPAGRRRRPVRLDGCAQGDARDLRGVLGSGVIALGLDADEPQLFVTVSDDLVARGISAGDLVTRGDAGDRRPGRRPPEMAQGRGTRREGLAEALAAIRAHLETGA